jgi:hypothetical protein
MFCSFLEQIVSTYQLTKTYTSELIENNKTVRKLRFSLENVLCYKMMVENA